MFILNTLLNSAHDVHYNNASEEFNRQCTAALFINRQIDGQLLNNAKKKRESADDRKIGQAKSENPAAAL